MLATTARGEPWDWDEVADDAGSTLPPEQLLDQVLPWSGRSAVMFAERLYPKPEQTAPRELFLRAALDAFPKKRCRRRSGSSWWPAPGGPGGPGRCSAADRVGPQPGTSPARMAEGPRALVACLGRLGRRRSHALAGLRIEPGNVDLQVAVERATDALARGGPLAAPGPPARAPVAGSR